MRLMLFRDHPAEGWPSMDRYAEAVRDALETVAPANWDIDMPMPPPPLWRGTHAQIVNRLTRYPMWTRTRRGDVNHILDHSYAHLLCALDPNRTVITVHDIAPLRFSGQGRGLSRLGWVVAWRAVRRARHLVVDSAFVGTELASSLRIGSRRIYVVPLAVASHFRRRSEGEIVATRAQFAPAGAHVLLHVGNTHPRKNLTTAIRALSLLRSCGLNVVLVQVGGLPDATLLQAIEEHQVQQHVRFAGRVAETQLVALYSAADVFIFPSLYEGFGLPILEAMACETPVVASNVASLPEVVGDAGILFDPTDAEAMASAIAGVLVDEMEAKRLKEAGLNRVRGFTWQRTAKMLLEVYREVNLGHGT